VFLVVFDYLSVFDRKNPVGAIRAFREAFNESYLNSALYASSDHYFDNGKANRDQRKRNEIMVIKSHQPGKMYEESRALLKSMYTSNPTATR
jgi:isochorismate hydrolase